MWSLAEGRIMNAPLQAQQEARRALAQTAYPLTYEEHVQIQRRTMLKDGRCVQGRHGWNDASVARSDGRISIWSEEFDIFKHGRPWQKVLFCAALAITFSVVAYVTFQPLL